ncbi:MAG: hypothetical protein J3K34DRAFT_523324 [Monoraphidium minutum]|nr:MAG: hypothetical protein J3K34DRAFT_523324 [Monoraphidium minutum]
MAKLRWQLMLACLAVAHARSLLTPAPAPAPAPAAARAASAPVPREAAAPEPVHYIFGYGSLLSRGSTMRSNCALTGLSEDNIAGACVRAVGRGLLKLLNLGGFNFSAVEQTCNIKAERAVRVKGLQRGWYAHVTNTKVAPASPFPGSAFNNRWTALGAVSKPGAQATGVIYEVGRKAYEKTLAREAAGGYAVARLPAAAAQVLAGPPLPAGAEITAFVAAPGGGGLPGPAADAPIPLSYIDVWLGGAADMQERLKLEGPAYHAASGGRYGSFVEETLKTTTNWRPYVTNDREQPLRPYETNHLADIDDALWRFVDHTVLAGMRYSGQPFAT